MSNSWAIHHRVAEGGVRIARVEMFHLAQEGGTRRRPTARNWGVSNVCLLRLETDDGIVGWADIETQPTVARAALDAPDQWSFLGHPPHDHGLHPMEVDRLWREMLRLDLLRPARRRDPGHVRGRQRLLRHHGQGLRRAALQAPWWPVSRSGEGVRVDALPTDTRAHAGRRPRVRRPRLPCHQVRLRGLPR